MNNIAKVVQNKQSNEDAPLLYFFREVRTWIGDRG